MASITPQSVFCHSASASSASASAPLGQRGHITTTTLWDVSCSVPTGVAPRASADFGTCGKHMLPLSHLAGLPAGRAPCCRVGGILKGSASRSNQSAEVNGTIKLAGGLGMDSHGDAVAIAIRRTLRSGGCSSVAHRGPQMHTPLLYRGLERGALSSGAHRGEGLRSALSSGVHREGGLRSGFSSGAHRGEVVGRRGVRVAAGLGGSPGPAGSEPVDRSGDTVELPLFPLPLVLFPGSILPLQIFEYRYRIMMQTLLQTDMRFGVLFTAPNQGTAAAVGCVGQVVRHERLPDDRFFVICKGEERFRVMDIVRTRPYLVGRVTWLEDRPSVTTPLTAPKAEGVAGVSPPSDLDALANEVAQIMSNVVRLSRKMKGNAVPPGSKQEDETAPLDIRKNAFPTPFSFWVASTFEGAPGEQQALLELVDTAERLKRERETLRNTLNYLTAAAAVKDAFKSSSSDSSSPP